MTAIRPQRRGNKIALTPEELDEFLRSERMVRLGSVGADGLPHVSPLWFVWDGTSLWLNSVVKSQRWTNLMRQPHVSAVIDSGVEFVQLRGVELIGAVEPVGDVPRGSDPDERVAEAERLFGDKYAGGAFASDGRHAWLRLTPEKIVSWDYRKMMAG